MTLADLREHLSGQSGTGDAKAIIRWARQLTDRPDYYGQILVIARAFVDLSADADHPLDNEHLMMCLAGFLIAPPCRWPGDKRIDTDNLLMTPRDRDLPGMCYPSPVNSSATCIGTGSSPTATSPGS